MVPHGEHRIQAMGRDDGTDGRDETWPTFGVGVRASPVNRCIVDAS